MLLPTLLRTLLCAALAAGGTACVHTRSQPVSSVTYRETEPWRVELVYGNPRRPHVVLAKIVVSSPHGLDRFEAEEELREEAAEYGAHAVLIDKRPGFGAHDRGSYQGIYGRAVRWTGPMRPPVVDW